MSKYHRRKSWHIRKYQARERDGNRCLVGLCGSRENLTVHHITPLNAGGNSKLNNLVTVCDRHHKLIHQLWD